MRHVSVNNFMSLDGVIQGPRHANAEVAVGGEVCDLDAAERAAENHTVAPLGLRRHRLVEIRSGDGDVVDALALLGEEARETLSSSSGSISSHITWPTMVTARRQERSTGSSYSRTSFAFPGSN